MSGEGADILQVAPEDETAGNDALIAAAAAAAAAGGTDEGVFFVSLSYRGANYSVPVQAEDPVAFIFDFVQEALDFPRENCKIIFRGKMIRPDHDTCSVGDAGLVSGSKLMLVASSVHDISFVQSSKADPLVKGFAEEERDEQNRKKRARAAGASAWGTKQDQEYRFNSIKAEFKYSDPPPFEAEKLLQKLSTDPGIIEIMKTHHFKVGILTEMSPAEAQERMAKRGTPNMDLLGYNQNAGEMIVLRLRTDNTKGFRPYHDLINTLIHELTHNVWGAHDHNFWRLYGELKAQYMKFHRFWSHGGHAADSNVNGQFQGFVGDDSPQQASGSGSGGFGNMLGDNGNSSGLAGSPRTRAAAAAQARQQKLTAAFEPSGATAAALGLPNFLAGDGTWSFVCPCGQTHSSEEMCDIGAALSAGAAAGEKLVADRQSEAAVAAAPAAPPAEQEETTPETVALLNGREQSLPEATSSIGAQLCLAPTESVAKETEAVASTSAAPRAPVPTTETATAAPEEPSLQASMGISDLEEQGLDGAFLWLQRFEGKLTALLGAPPGRPAAREAVSMLLRLVRNIIENPHEQKFRRIRADNPKIRASLLGAGAEVEALMALVGFEPAQEAGESVFVLRDAVFDIARLRMGKELLERELSTEATQVQ